MSLKNKVLNFPMKRFNKIFLFCIVLVLSACSETKVRGILYNAPESDLILSYSINNECVEKVIPIKNKGFEFDLEEVNTTEYSLYYKNQPKERLIFWASSHDKINIKEQYPWQMSYVRGGELNNELTNYKKYIGEAYAEMYRIQRQLSEANKQHNDSLFFTILHRTNVSELERNVENMRLKYVENHPLVDSLLSVIE